MPAWAEELLADKGQKQEVLFFQESVERTRTKVQTYYQKQFGVLLQESWVLANDIAVSLFWSLK